MGHNIKRINDYEDIRFDKEVLKQHGGFMVDEKYPCSFKIINEDSAVVTYNKEIHIHEVIDEFRFYTEHIVNFFNEDGSLIKKFQPLDIFYVDIKDIQTSQFFVDMDKVRAVESFIHSEEDICVPLAEVEGELVSLDGHTRLYYGAAKGFTRVRAFVTSPGDYIEGFVHEAKKRNVYSPYDLKLISHEEYKIKWDKFCDDFFRSKRV